MQHAHWLLLQTKSSASACTLSAAARATAASCGGAVEAPAAAAAATPPTPPQSPTKLAAASPPGEGAQPASTTNISEAASVRGALCLSSSPSNPVREKAEHYGVPHEAQGHLQHAVTLVLAYACLICGFAVGLALYAGRLVLAAPLHSCHFAARCAQGSWLAAATLLQALLAVTLLVAQAVPSVTASAALLKAGAALTSNAALLAASAALLLLPELLRLLRIMGQAAYQVAACKDLDGLHLHLLPPAYAAPKDTSAAAAPATAVVYPSAVTLPGFGASPLLQQVANSSSSSSSRSSGSSSSSSGSYRTPPSSSPQTAPGRNGLMRSGSGSSLSSLSSSRSSDNNTAMTCSSSSGSSGVLSWLPINRFRAVAAATVAAAQTSGADAALPPSPPSPAMPTAAWRTGITSSTGSALSPRCMMNTSTPAVAATAAAVATAAAAASAVAAPASTSLAAPHAAGAALVNPALLYKNTSAAASTSTGVGLVDSLAYICGLWLGGGFRVGFTLCAFSASGAAIWLRTALRGAAASCGVALLAAATLARLVLLLLHASSQLLLHCRLQLPLPVLQAALAAAQGALLPLHAAASWAGQRLLGSDYRPASTSSAGGSTLTARLRRLQRLLLAAVRWLQDALAGVRAVLAAASEALRNAAAEGHGSPVMTLASLLWAAAQQGGLAACSCMHAALGITEGAAVRLVQLALRRAPPMTQQMAAVYVSFLFNMLRRTAAESWALCHQLLVLWQQHAYTC